MNVFIDEKSRETLSSRLEKKSKPYAVRIRVLKVGWAGPLLGFALEEQKENVEYILEEGINFVLDDSVKLYNQDVKIYTGKKLFGDGEGLVIQLA